MSAGGTGHSARARGRPRVLRLAVKTVARVTETISVDHACVERGPRPVTSTCAVARGSSPFIIRILLGRVWPRVLGGVERKLVVQGVEIAGPVVGRPG